MRRTTAMLLLIVGPPPAATFASISRAATAPHASRAVIRSAAIRMDMDRRSHERPETGGHEPSEAKQLLQRIKDAGVAGAVSYAAWELAFWAASVPVCLVAYYQLTGHWPDFSDQDDMAKLGAEAFAFVNVARFAVPLRIGLALSTVPWVQANIIDRFARMRGDATAPEAGPEAAAPEAHWPGTPPPDATVWHAEWDAAAPVEHWQGVVAPTATEAGPEAGWPPAVPPAVPSVATAAGQRSAPDILLGGLSNLGKDPDGWCFGPPSPLYSNAGSAPAAGPPAAGLQFPTAAAPAAAVGVSQPASNEGEATRDIEVSVAQAEATRCEEEELEAKRAWLAKASGSGRR